MKQPTLHTASTQWPLSPHQKWMSNCNPFYAKNQPEPPTMQSWLLLSGLQGPAGNDSTHSRTPEYPKTTTPKYRWHCIPNTLLNSHWKQASQTQNKVRLLWAHQVVQITSTWFPFICELDNRCPRTEQKGVEFLQAPVVLCDRRQNPFHVAALSDKIGVELRREDSSSCHGMDASIQVGPI